MTLPKFRRIERVRTFDSILNELRTALDDGRLEPGTKLPSEPMLASQMGVSRSILREALKALELSGYLEIRRGYGGGTFVSHTAPEEFQPIPPPIVDTGGVTIPHLWEIRRAIEPAAAEIAATALPLPERTLLPQASAISIDDRRPARVLAADVDFHVGVARASGNPVFMSLLESLRPIFYRALRNVVLTAAWREESRTAHARILEAIASGNANGAASAMREHLASEARLCG